MNKNYPTINNLIKDTLDYLNQDIENLNRQRSNNIVLSVMSGVNLDEFGLQSIEYELDNKIKEYNNLLEEYNNLKKLLKPK